MTRGRSGEPDTADLLLGPVKVKATWVEACPSRIFAPSGAITETPASQRNLGHAHRRIKLLPEKLALEQNSLPAKWSVDSLWP